jgi:alanine racemase
MRPTWATIDLDAIEHNVRALRAMAHPAALCAVVKANGYGHGAAPAARAALRGGATWLAVAFVDEALELRDAGIDAPILVLSEPRPTEMHIAYNANLRVTVYSHVGIHAAAEAAHAAKAVGAAPPDRWPVQLKVDTGMNRVGAAVVDVVSLADSIAGSEVLELEGVWTHCAVADAPDDAYTETQLARLAAVLTMLAAGGHHPSMVHAANSAGAIAHPSARFDLVRCGIAIYGIAPSAALDAAIDLRPALSLRSEIVHLHEVPPGDGVSYGRRWRASRPTQVATVPIGYADGVRRSLGLDGGVVLVRGIRCPILGVVTMDQLVVDVSVVNAEVGDEVILIGRQGADAITANEIGALIDTIGYEITCAISSRVPRRYEGTTA